MNCLCWTLWIGAEEAQIAFPFSVGVGGAAGQFLCCLCPTPHVWVCALWLSSSRGGAQPGPVVQGPLSQCHLLVLLPPSPYALAQGSSDLLPS